MRDELLLRPLWLAAWLGQSSLIEPSLGSTSGVPDAHLVDDGFPPGWLEFKAFEADGSFKIRPEQRAWAREFLAYSPRVALCVMDRAGFYLLPMIEVVANPFRKKYQLNDLPSPCRYTGWDRIEDVSLPKMLELVYVTNAHPA